MPRRKVVPSNLNQQEENHSLAFSAMTSEELGLNRSNSSCCRSTRKILPSNYIRSSSLSTQTTTKKTTISSSSSSSTSLNTTNNISKPKNIFIRSLLQILSLSTTCRYWLASSPVTGLSRNNHKYKLTGTLFGHKKGHVTFAVQDDPRSDPVLLLELATSTSTLVKEMASGLLRIALECKRSCSHSPSSTVKLFHEPMWTMYCNGKKCGYAISRTCGESDWHVLNMVRSVSIGAGVIPVHPDDQKKALKNGGGGEDQTGEFMYMRAKFERVVGSRDSEAFYMLNPDGSGGPELSIFLLRI